MSGWLACLRVLSPTTEWAVIPIAEGAAGLVRLIALVASALGIMVIGHIVVRRPSR